MHVSSKIHLGKARHPPIPEWILVALGEEREKKEEGEGRRRKRTLQTHPGDVP